MDCPNCHISLDKAKFYSGEIDYCSKCSGFWFEEDELRKTKDQKDNDLNWLDVDLWEDKNRFKISEGKRQCPSCEIPLYEINYDNSEIKVDLCDLCRGIWLDRGEFKKIIDYLREKSDWEALNNYSKNLIRELKEIFSGPETLKEELVDFLSILKVLNYKFASKYPTIASIIINLPRG